MNAIWIPVVSAFLASVFSLLIAWFTNCWNERRFNKQLKHEREKDSKKLLIEKGEKLIILLYSFVQWGSHRLGYESIDELPTKHEFDYIEFEFIAKTYFPEFENDISLVLENLKIKDDSSEIYKCFILETDKLKSKISLKLNELSK
ncbi:hypothetical protein ACNFJN_05105 [Xenorhabdus budapestensis]|uniref:hypothetical protein n=1 Tax=Xenorhabdus budapestensis TaxID=290110 RepID=UPI003A850415